MIRNYRTLLTIAGSDSIGGAGIQADIKTATSLGVYAMSVITAVTAQNTLGVKDFEAVTPHMLQLQLSTVVSDVRPDSIKIGMIPNAELAEVIADFLEEHRFGNVVLDPVMVATSGDRLSLPETLPILKQRLIPASSLITPNIPEAELLSGRVIRTTADAADVGIQLAQELNCPAILVKGGHFTDGGIMTDVLVESQPGKLRVMEYPHPALATRNTHGTGCTLSSAVASYLSMGQTIGEAVRNGIDYMQKALTEGADYSFGSSEGHGPVMHFFKLFEE